MKSHKFKFVAMMMVSVATAAGGSRAIAEDRPAKKASKADAKVANSGDPPRIAVRIDNARRLRQMMDEKIHLSLQQAAAINRVFDDYAEDLRNTYARGGQGVPARAGNKVLPPTVSQMKQERTAAEAIGDKNRVEELDREISARRREPLLPGDNHVESLRAKIIPHLKDDQVAEFDKVMERWNLIVPKGPRTGPFQRLRRSLLDPEVGISAEQREEFDKILDAALRAGRTGREGSRDKLAQEVEKAKVKIFAQLSSEQQKKVEADLQLFKSVEKQYDDSMDRYRAKSRAKGNGAASKPSAGSAPGATSESDKSNSEAADKPTTPQP